MIDPTSIEEYIDRDGYQAVQKVIEEFTPDGKLVEGYPELVVNTRDNYLTTGIYRISLEL